MTQCLALIKIEVLEKISKRVLCTNTWILNNMRYLRHNNKYTLQQLIRRAFSMQIINTAMASMSKHNLTHLTILVKEDYNINNHVLWRNL